MEHQVICTLLTVFTLVLSTLAEDQTELCDVSPRERVNCGYPGVTASDCEKKGCCFDDTVSGYPWCFYTTKSTSEAGTVRGAREQVGKRVGQRAAQARSVSAHQGAGFRAHSGDSKVLKKQV
ncbi:PREDICTED: trefoil factor 1 [Galeopterus variegatus]|uniref:Trefoil factor 1 n=1 Tax=Galeopterus variegatus TaxID=482537 RepID=A0ABM0R3E5_GALVR|nr:PREDICTED: trefoil factor 1 [Galeopterus variegatus]